MTARGGVGGTGPTSRLATDLGPRTTHRTAIARQSLSRPVQLLVDVGLLAKDTTLFDYGCGRGDDIRLLSQAGFEARGWDPVSAADSVRCEADIVNLGYVINVIPDPRERVAALREAWALARSVLVVAARLSGEMQGHLQPHRDGWLTGNGTFQKFFTQFELRTWIDDALGVESIAAAPGIFMVFRDFATAESFLQERRRRPAAPVPVSKRDALFERHRFLLEALMAFFSDRGRLPVPGELPQTNEIAAALGSVARAWQVVSHVTGTAAWADIRAQRAAELRVHLALARLRKRPRYSRLPSTMQYDVKALFGSYRAACDEADALLWGAGDLTAVSAACRAAGIGKLTPTDLYVHRSLVDALPPLLKVYEGCARWVAGEVAGSNVVKLAWDKPKVSYLSYPDFDRAGHPVLDASVVIHLADQSLELRDYATRENPPILHRKEHLVGLDYPGREKFERLTRQEERHGLYENARRIGTRDGWSAALEAAGVEVRGHRLYRRRPTEPTEDAGVGGR